MRVEGTEFKMSLLNLELCLAAKDRRGSSTNAASGCEHRWCGHRAAVFPAAPTAPLFVRPWVGSATPPE